MMASSMGMANCCEPRNTSNAAMTARGFPVATPAPRERTAQVRETATMVKGMLKVVLKATCFTRRSAALKARRGHHPVVAMKMTQAGILHR